MGGGTFDPKAYRSFTATKHKAELYSFGPTRNDVRDPFA